MDADTAEPDPQRLRSWLAESFDPSVSSVTIQRLGGGHSSGAWRLDAAVADGRRSMVLKAPAEPSVVFQRDVCREARILDELNRAGAPVPAVFAMDTGTRAVGRPCFVMELIDGRSVADGSPGGYHDDVELREASFGERRAIWESFHDALAALHSVDPTRVPSAARGRGTCEDVLAYWRRSLLDAVPATAAPRQLKAIDWLAANRPADADASPAVCLGDSRLVNGIIADGRIRALVDFEVGYLGNPAADIGYSLLMEQLHSGNAEHPLALPGADETWDRWSSRTRRLVKDRGYWMAFGATILCVTATRAMIQWGLAGDDIESTNPVVSVWESLIGAGPK
jgi:aminoglycoside phosphotransferase (APT) family kinase protein